jgi:hypothetical protein
MGLMSSLALALIPLVRRSGNTSPPAARLIDLEGERDRQYEENVALIIKIAALEHERDEARADAERWEALARSWEARYHEAMNPVLERGILAQQRQQALYQLAMQQQAQQPTQAQLNAQNFYSQALFGQSQLGVFSGDCTCVPGRSALLRGD